MPLSDLFAALPGIVLVCLIPGFAVATLCVPRWRWWERLAASPGLGCGLVGVVGAVYHDVHISFQAATVLPVAVLAVVAAVLRRRSLPYEPRQEPPHSAAVPVAALLAGVVTAGAFVATYRHELRPTATDAPVHATMAVYITRTHDALPLVPEPVDGTSWVRPQMASEATGALISEIGGPDASAVAMPLATLALLLIPLSLAMLALETSGDVRLAAAAPLLGVGLAFPYVPVAFAESHLLLDSTLVVAPIVAVVRALHGRNPRDHLALMAAVTLSIWMLHGLEAITATVIGGPLVLGLLLRRTPAPSWRGLLAAATGGVAGAVMGWLLLRPPATPTPVFSDAGRRVSEVTEFVGIQPNLRLADVFSSFTGILLPAQVIGVLLAAGAYAALRTGRLRWALLAAVGIFLAFYDVLTHARLRAVWDRLLPWSGVDRLVSIEYWVVPLLMALALVTVGDAVARSPRPRVRSYTALAAAGIVLAVMAAGAARDVRSYRDSVAESSYVTPADVQVMDAMQAALPAHAVVMTDGLVDAGQWVGAMTRDVTFLSKGYLQGFPGDGHVLALSRACSTTPDRSLYPGVDAVFVGALQHPGPQAAWDESCLERIPWLRLIARVNAPSGVAAAFRVVG